MEQTITWGAAQHGMYEKIETDGIVQEEVYCYAELHAQMVMNYCGLSSFNFPMDPHKAGNKIIEWAETIKAQRAVLAMNKR
jgi:hypothetical protein